MKRLPCSRPPAILLVLPLLLGACRSAATSGRAPDPVATRVAQDGRAATEAPRPARETLAPWIDAGAPRAARTRRRRCGPEDL